MIFARAFDRGRVFVSRAAESTYHSQRELREAFSARHNDLFLACRPPSRLIPAHHEACAMLPSLHFRCQVITKLLRAINEHHVIVS